MALRKLPTATCRWTTKNAKPSGIFMGCSSRRYASGEAEQIREEPTDLHDLESLSSFTSIGADPQQIQAYNPIRRSQGRRRELPPSRYQYKSPRYYRGPLHPHQPPPTSDPSSRQFIPGPFSYTRLEQTYKSTIASDLMTLAYSHKPPGTVTAPKAERLRTWDDTSPYHKGRPKRGPRGPGDVLRLIEKDITWQNIPKLEAITIHSMVKGAAQDSAYLHVAGIMLQAVTGVRPEVHRVKHNVNQWGLRVRMPISLTCELRGEQAYHFLDKCVNLVFPRIKDWQGVKGSTGDSSGNITWGFDRAGAILFPEVEINYDMYPPHMIPGFHVTVKTTATSDRHARMLLQSMGVPFFGKMVD